MDTDLLTDLLLLDYYGNQLDSESSCCLGVFIVLAHLACLALILLNA